MPTLLGAALIDVALCALHQPLTTRAPQRSSGRGTRPVSHWKCLRPRPRCLTASVAWLLTILAVSAAVALQSFLDPAAVLGSCLMAMHFSVCSCCEAVNGSSGNSRNATATCNLFCQDGAASEVSRASSKQQSAVIRRITGARSLTAYRGRHPGPVSLIDLDRPQHASAGYS